MHERLATEINGRVAAIHTVARTAAAVDGEAMALWQEVEETRRIGASRVIDRVAALGSLRHGVSREMAIDVVWLLSDSDLYKKLVLDRTWAAERYTKMITETMQQQLLPG